MTEGSHRLRHHGKHHQNDLWRVTDLRDVITTTPPSAIDRTYTCYTTNEVLVIIGLTCVLNLAFVALVMSCVHFCSSPSLSRISRLVDNTTSESDLEDAERKKHTMLNASDSYPINRRRVIESYLKGITLPVQAVVPQTCVQLPPQSLESGSPSGLGPRPRLKAPASSLSMECLLFV